MSPQPAAALPHRLLAADEPHPLEVFNPQGGSDFFLICEHAGRLLPASLGTLGLDEADRSRHIAWDIGARDIAMELARLLDAPLYMQRYSRLVCDCNRQPDVATFIPDISETTVIPGNANLSPGEIGARVGEIFQPFHDAVTQALDARDAAGRRTILATVHSFTPVYKGISRPWQIGVLFNRDAVLSPQIVRYLEANTDYEVGVNQPYAVSDDTDYAIPVHGEKRGYPCVEFEIRNDLTSGRQAVDGWAGLLADSLRHAAATMA